MITSRKKYIVISVFCCVIIFFNSCATLLSESSYPVVISTNPPGAKVSIKDKQGFNFYVGHTPVYVDLPAKSGYFSKAFYLVTIQKESYETKLIPITFSIDEFYFYNALSSSFFIGMLIIDPISGAMWKTNTKFIHENLQKSK